MKKLTREERHRRRFSEQFKKELVSLIEQGKLTQAQVSRTYDVRDTCVSAWLDKYGTNRKKGLIMVSSKKDYDKMSSKDQEIKELKQVIGEQQVKVIYMEKLLELYRVKYGDDLEKK
jgi:transposase-like protein